MIDVITCPKCGGPMSFQDGAIDKEFHVNDFCYCKECGGFGYDLLLADEGRWVPVVKLYLAIKAKPEDIDCSTAEHTYGWNCPACHGRDCVLGNPL